MNFLAHLLLSCEDEATIVGNFLGDFVKNRDLPNYSEEIRKGIMLHREIDTYTDNHPVVRQGTARLRGRHGKYAPVVVDVLYDYILSKEWERYGPKPLPDFASDTYDVLLRNSRLMPAWLAERTELMVADDWLRQYQSYAGISNTFLRLKRRVSKPELLLGVEESLREEEEALTAEFNQFFPQIVGHVNWFCNC